MFEWDVQLSLSEAGLRHWGKTAAGKSHINVTPR